MTSCQLCCYLLKCALCTLPLPVSTGALGWRNHNQARQGRRRGAARVPRFTVLGSYQSLQLKPEHYDVRRMPQ